MPVIVIIPCSVSILVRCVLCSSSPSAPISARIVKIVVYFLLDAEIIFIMFSVVGIRGVPSATL